MRLFYKFKEGERKKTRKHALKFLYKFQCNKIILLIIICFIIILYIYTYKIHIYKYKKTSQAVTSFKKYFFTAFKHNETKHPNQILVFIKFF
jgi:hypothetical protein